MERHEARTAMEPMKPGEPPGAQGDGAGAGTPGRFPESPARAPLPSPEAIRATVETEPPVSTDLEPYPPDSTGAVGDGAVGGGEEAARPVGERPEADDGDPLVLPLPAVAGQPPGVERVEVVVDGWRFEVRLEPARRAVLRERARRSAGPSASGPRVVRAPLPGRIVRVFVAPGDEVETGTRLCSLEAMKMENEILAPAPGTIERVGVEAGARVEQGDDLVVIG